MVIYRGADGVEVEVSSNCTPWKGVMGGSLLCLLGQTTRKAKTGELLLCRLIAEPSKIGTGNYMRSGQIK